MRLPSALNASVPFIALALSSKDAHKPKAGRGVGTDAWLI
jgi:hypothetical protein